MDATTKTTEEIILAEWTYIQKLFKAYEDIKLINDNIEHSLESNLGNEPMIFKLKQSLAAKQVKTGKLSKLTGLDMTIMKDYFRKELSSSGKYILQLYSNLQCQVDAS